MNEYPSILGPNKAPSLPCLAFYKYDGSNLRWEWSRKRGWNKFGTRKHLFDETDAVFGPAIPIFMDKYADAIEKVIKDSKQYRNAEYITAFTEFFGPNSFAGQHNPSDKKELVLFDLQVHKRGILDPRTFIKTFGHLDTAKVVYEGNLNASFIDDVKNSKYDLNEGVVCKGGTGHGLWMRKIKTLVYLQKLKGKYGDHWEQHWE